MKLKYLIPIIGLFLIWNDIPHTESERPYKPLQGTEALVVMWVSLSITGVSIIGLIHLFS